MQKKWTYVIGLMSGTSLDGLDLVYVQFNNEDNTDFKILEAKTKSYSTIWKNDLQNAINYSDERLNELNKNYGKLLGNLILDFVSEFNITQVDFVASHGHTVFHQPEKGITLQIGDGQEIANITGYKIVCDFRTQDVVLGGQGAPLVPIGDELLFGEYDYCVNLGGFANISFKQNNQRLAFDICPVNIVLNHYTRKLGLEYDEDGKLASKGIINEKLLEKLNSLDFYKKTAPKSLGLEWVQINIFPLIDSLEEDTNTILRTFIEHVALQISNCIHKKSNILFTGGGTFNTFLMKRIRFYTEGKENIASKQLIDFKEALVFAFLGLLRTRNEVNCLKSVTGASKNHSSGVVFIPNN